MNDAQYAILHTVVSYLGALFGLYVGFNMVFKQKVGQER